MTFGFPNRMMRAVQRGFLSAALGVAGLADGAASSLASESPGDLSRRWAFDAGVAFITSNNIDDILHGRVNVSDGDAGGQIYKLTASRLLYEFALPTGYGVLRPQLELPLTLEVVDEIGRSPFLDYNASVMARWVDFPWRDKVYTTVAIGGGFSYSTKILAMDAKRHPNRDRSRFEFNMPIQITLARPESPHHQLTLFLVHQSGGKIFDRGGMNSVGLGYRLGFE